MVRFYCSISGITNGNQIRREWGRMAPRGAQSGYGIVTFTDGESHGKDTAFELREYDGFDRLMRVWRDSVQTLYRYRPDGLRHSKATGTSHNPRREDDITLHHWDGEQMVAESAANGNLKRRYLRGLDLVAMQIDANLHYYAFNPHGDVVRRTNQQGTALKSYEYDAFGNERSPDPLDPNPFRYCAEYFDVETECYYLRARYYNPVTGRMCSQDSVRGVSSELPGGQEVVDPLSLNLYTYCGNNPIRFVDPSGNFALTAAVGLSAFAIGAIFTLLAGLAVLATAEIKRQFGSQIGFFPGFDLSPKSGPSITTTPQSKGNGIGLTTLPQMQEKALGLIPGAKMQQNQIGLIQGPAIQQRSAADNFYFEQSGLDWGITSKSGETRTQHVNLHSVNDLQKLNHGVFYGNPVDKINHAWNYANSGKKITQGGVDIYSIPYANSGYAGGYSGNGDNLNYIDIITKKGTNKLITGYPSRGR